MTIYYLTNHVTDEQAQEYADVIKKYFKEGMTHGANFEKLRGHKIYSLRANDKARILFSYKNINGKMQPVVLEILENHEYHKAKCLKEHFLKQFAETMNTVNFAAGIQDEDFESIENPITNDDSADFTLEPMHYIHEQFLIFDEQQNKALSVPTPLLLEGPPGSGKTSVAFSCLLQAAQKTEKPKLLYVTHSKFLVKKIKDEWEKQSDIKADIFTYETLIDLEFGGGVIDTDKTREVLQNWLQPYLKKTKPDPALRDVESVYQEFRTISGYSEANYTAITFGEKQTLFKDQQHRQWLYQAYQAWLAHLKVTGLNPCEFTSFKVKKKYDFITVDESLDFSGLQLLQLAKMADNGNIIYCVDPRQSLLDDVSKLTFLKHLFGDKLTHINLDQHYRCPLDIMKFALPFNQLRKELTPAQKSEPAIHLPTTNTNTGHIYWMEPKIVEAKDWQLFISMKDDANVCVITNKNLIGEVKKLGFLQVFTPEEIKGLDYKTVIAYNLLSQPIYKEANHELSGANNFINKNVKFASAFARCFVSITRALDTVIIVQDKGYPINHIIDRLNPTLPFTSNVFNATTSTSEEWEKQACLLYKTNYKKQALAILRERLKFQEDAIKQWELDLLPKPSPLSGKHEIPVATTNFKKLPERKSVSTTPENANKIEIIPDVKLMTNADTATPKSPSASNKKIKKPNPSIQKPPQKISVAEQFFKALTEQNAKLIDELLEKNNHKIENHPNRNGDSLHLASISNRLKAVKALIRGGANTKSMSASQTFFKVVQEGFADIARELLKAGANKNTISILDGDHWAAIHVASAHGDLLTLQALLDYKADIHATAFSPDITRNHYTALHCAATTGHVAILKALLKAGASIEALTDEGLTPLHLAAQANQPLIIRELLKAGANIEAKATNGSTPLFEAITEKCMEAFNELMNKGANVHHEPDGVNSIMIAARQNQPEMIRRLLKAKVSPDKKGINELTALHFTAKQGYIEIVQLLIEANADVNAIASSSNLTPVFIALEKQHEAIVRLLIAAGANLNIHSTQGPLLASVLNSNISDDLVALLIRKGAAVAPLFRYKNLNRLLIYIFETKDVEAAAYILAHAHTSYLRPVVDLILTSLPETLITLKEKTGRDFPELQVYAVQTPPLKQAIEEARIENSLTTFSLFPPSTQGSPTEGEMIQPPRPPSPQHN